MSGSDSDDDSTIRVGYEVILEVGIDRTSGEVVDVTVYTEDANTSAPIHVYDETDVDGYLAESHPRYGWAAQRAEQIEIGASKGRLANDRDNVPWRSRP